MNSSRNDELNRIRPLLVNEEDDVMEEEQEQSRQMFDHLDEIMDLFKSP